MPDAYGAPSPYARTPFMPPWLKGTLIVGGGLAAGALVSRTAMAAMKPEVLPTPGPTPTPTPGPEPTPTPAPEPIRIYMERAFDVLGRPDAKLVSEDSRFVPTKQGKDGFIVGALPVRVLISAPEAFWAPSTVETGPGNKLLAGTPSESYDFMFSIEEYAPQSPDGSVHQDNYSVMISAQFPAEGSGYQIPLRVFAVPQ